MGTDYYRCEYQEAVSLKRTQVRIEDLKKWVIKMTVQLIQYSTWAESFL